MSSEPVPMFPLGSVLMPSAVLPLHIFEPRYRRMMDVVMDRPDQSFGVVLIEQGHEVGGEDRRRSVGTMARVIEGERAPDGRWGVVSVGTGRIRVDEWLPDDPYPRARISDWPDLSIPTEADELHFRANLIKHRRLLGLSSELGYDVGALPELSEDPVLGGFQIAATAPLSTLDRYLILAAPDLPERLELIDQMLESAVSLAEMELAQAMLDPLDPLDPTGEVDP